MHMAAGAPRGGGRKILNPRILAKEVELMWLSRFIIYPTPHTHMALYMAKYCYTWQIIGLY